MDQNPTFGNPTPPPPHGVSTHSAPAWSQPQAAATHHIPRPQVVHIVAKPGGFARAVMFMLGLAMFGLVFLVGVAIGINIMVLGAERDSLVVQQLYREGGDDIIAILPVMGGIDDSQAEFVHACVRTLLEDPSVSAVVLRVDSPGGGVTASDQIWYEVERLKLQGLPVIASYGSMAASGGYYVSCAADHIMAEETCITGSIGVIAQILTLEGLMDKVGVKPVTLVAHGSPQKNVANDMFRTWNDEDRSKILAMLDSAYTTFHKRVSDGRAGAIADKSKIDAVANGSIYTAQQALENGLVDSIGYLDDAIAKAESVAGITKDSATVIMLRQPASLFGDGLFAGVKASTPSFDADQLRTWVNELSAPRMMYLMH